MINTETVQVTYLTRADQTTRYSIPFVYNKNELTDAPELTVTLNGSELVFGTDYTVNESGLQLVNAVDEGLLLVILRASVFEQLRDFQTGLIDPEQIEGGFDDSVMRDQELKRDIQAVAESLATETEERINADTILQDAIDDEANARLLADGVLQTNIDNEALARSGADTTLQNNIYNEARARSDADVALQASIDTKQDIIADLATIRSGAAAGATAVQPAELSAVTGAIDNRVTRIENVVPQNASSSNKLATRADIPAAPAIDGVVLTPTTTKADLGLSNLYTFKGNVSTYANLPATGNVVGDVYNVEDTGNNYAWTENGWDSLGGEFTAPVSSVNGMTGAVVLSASDVGALPTTGGTMTGQITLGYGANIVGNNRLIDIGSSQYPIHKVYVDTLSGGDDQGRFMIPAADPSTFGFFIAIVNTMPTAREDLEGMIFQYMGATDSNYTHGYFYECVTDDNTTWYWKQLDVQPTGSSYTAGSGIDITNDVISTTSDVLKNLASVSTSLNIGTTTLTDRGGATSVGINAMAGNWGTAVGNTTNAAPYTLALGHGARAEATGAIQLSCGGGMRYNSVANTFKVANQNGNFEIMSADGTVPTARLTRAINKYSTMPTAASTNEGWIVQFTGTTDSNYTHGYIYECVTDDNTTYYWKQMDVQPSSGGATYTAGTGIDITNNAISVQMPVHYNENGAYAIGIATQEPGISDYYSVAIGTLASAGSYGVNIGGGGPVPQGTVSIGWFESTPSEQGVVLFHTMDSNFNYHTYKMLEADGTVPADRLASTANLADGNYRLRCTITNGVPTLSWVAE